MNSLMSYGSDDNSDDSGDERFPEMPGRPNVSVSKNYRKPASHEDNYEEVGMDMSEDSNDSTAHGREEPKSNQVSKQGRSTNTNPSTSGQNSSSSSSSSCPQPGGGKSDSRSPKHKREDERRNSKNKDDRHKVDDRYRRRDERGNKGEDRNRRDNDKGRDRYREDRREKREDRYGRDRRDRKRSRSRDKRRSRSPRRSRSSSRDRGPRGFPSRKEKADKRMDRLDKLGIEFKPDNYPASAIEEAERNSKSNSGGDRFFMPGITGRFREQIEKRKLLWQKAKEPDPVVPSNPMTLPISVAPASGSKATKVYEATSFADDKTSNKFKRLMGIRETDASSLPVKSTDVLKKQQEMFTSMEAQYEVARTATHTMRGMGLGFGSFQR